MQFFKNTNKGLLLKPATFFRPTVFRVVFFTIELDLGLRDDINIFCKKPCLLLLLLQLHDDDDDDDDANDDDDCHY